MSLAVCHRKGPQKSNKGNFVKMWHEVTYCGKQILVLDNVYSMLYNYCQENDCDFEKENNKNVTSFI